MSVLNKRITYLLTYLLTYNNGISVTLKTRLEVVQGH